MNTMLIALAMAALAAIITGVAEWWATGPGTTPLRREPMVIASVLPLIDFNQQVDFEDGQNATALVWGWSSPEPWGVWTFGDRATIGLRLLGKARQTDNPTLILQVHAFLAPPKVQMQRIVLRLGWLELAEVAVNQSDTEVAMSLKGADLPRDPVPLVLTLDLPDAISPYVALGTGDYRTLAIGIKSLRLVP